MAFTQSGIFTDNILDALANASDLDLVQGATGMKIALFNDGVTVTAASDYDVLNAQYGSGDWSAGANEATGTNWAAGGVDLANTTLTVADPAAGQLSFDGDDISVANTTISDIRGCLVYHDTSTSPVVDLAVVGVAFSGAPYATSNGTLAITWDANGIFYLDLVP